MSPEEEICQEGPQTRNKTNILRRRNLSGGTTDKEQDQHLEKKKPVRRDHRQRKRPTSSGEETCQEGPQTKNETNIFRRRNLSGETTDKERDQHLQEKKPVRRDHRQRTRPTSSGEETCQEGPQTKNETNIFRRRNLSGGTTDKE